MGNGGDIKRIYPPAPTPTTILNVLASKAETNLPNIRLKFVWSYHKHLFWLNEHSLSKKKLCLRRSATVLTRCNRQRSEDLAPANSVATKETAETQAASGRSKVLRPQLSYLLPVALAYDAWTSFCYPGCEFCWRGLKDLTRLFGLVIFLGSHIGEQVTEKLLETTVTFTFENHKNVAVWGSLPGCKSGVSATNSGRRLCL